MNTEGAITASSSAMFSALYAAAVPKYCPRLSSDQKAIDRLVAVARVAWAEHLVRNRLVHGSLKTEVTQHEQLERRSADAAARIDHGEIPDFCDRVLEVFGEAGRLHPDLLKDTRRKA